MSSAVLVPWPLPWWLGALSLAALVVGTWFILRRPLGVSSSWIRVASAGEESTLRAMEEGIARDEAAFVAALMAETQAQFGADVPASPQRQTESVVSAVKVRVPWTAHATFLLFVAIGGSLGAFSRGTWSVRDSLGPDFEALFGVGLGSFAVLILGGVLIGFGTRMAGGCPSGHGLSGLSRFQLGSLLSTCAFFGAAVFASLLLRWGLR